MNSEPRLSTLDYLVEVAKDWATSHFANADGADFTLPAHRFKLDGSTVRRKRLRSDAHEAADPLAAARGRRGAAAWARTDKVVLIVDCLDGVSRSYEQEIVEIIGVEGDDVVAEAAIIVRFPDLPPCLGRFWNVM